MRINSRLYKTLSQEDFEKLNFKISREYYYLGDGVKKEIKEQRFENTNNNKLFQLVDDDYEWNPKEQNLYLTINLELSNLNALFGENGICYSDAKIGVGIVWKPEKSRIKRCKKLCEFTQNDNSINTIIEDIELQNISSNVEFTIVFYIVEKGKNNGKPFFANEEGMIIYNNSLWSIIVDGNGSIFPIFETEDNGPVWSYYCDTVDISEDSFDKDHVGININKKHPSYDLIHPKSPNYSQAYVNEILSTAIAFIILDLRSKSHDNFIDLTEDCDEGSILSVLKYFKDKLDFKINDSFNELISSIKKYFDKEI